MKPVSLVSGRLTTDAVRYRVLDQIRVWRCSGCHQQCVRRGDHLYDPSEDGERLVEHPCAFVNKPRVAANVRGTMHLGCGRGSRPGIRVVDGGKSHTVLLCFATGCEKPLRRGVESQVAGRKMFCWHHWFMLPIKLRRWIASENGRWLNPALKSACKYIRLKEAQKTSEREVVTSPPGVAVAPVIEKGASGDHHPAQGGTSRESSRPRPEQPKTLHDAAPAKGTTARHASATPLHEAGDGRERT